VRELRKGWPRVHVVNCVVANLREGIKVSADVVGDAEVPRVEPCKSLTDTDRIGVPRAVLPDVLASRPLSASCPTRLVFVKTADVVLMLREEFRLQE
jgi:hypothetical protein